LRQDFDELRNACQANMQASLASSWYKKIISNEVYEMSYFNFEVTVEGKGE
jgi:hypothetical protein